MQIRVYTRNVVAKLRCHYDVRASQSEQTYNPRNMSYTNYIDWDSSLYMIYKMLKSLMNLLIWTERGLDRGRGSLYQNYTRKGQTESEQPLVSKKPEYSCRRHFAVYKCWMPQARGRSTEDPLPIHHMYSALKGTRPTVYAKPELGRAIPQRDRNLRFKLRIASVV